MSLKASIKLVLRSIAHDILDCLRAALSPASISGALAPRARVRRFRARGRVVVADDSPSYGFELGGFRLSIDLSRCAPWSIASAQVIRWSRPLVALLCSLFWTSTHPDLQQGVIHCVSLFLLICLIDQRMGNKANCPSRIGDGVRYCCQYSKRRNRNSDVRNIDTSVACG